MARLDEGMRAPGFTLTNQRGERVSLSSLRGQRVILYFYPADDTPGCTAEACGFNDALAGLSRAGVRVVGVSPDGVDSHSAFASKYSLGFDLLADPTHKVMEAYGAWGEKTLYGKKVVGVIRSTFVVSSTGRVERAWYGVKATGHAERVVAQVAQLP
ncbi:MAG TPA: thioredoxin-dependent thiol peroxidase [Acidimicrobiales bacterium]|nr:thioredoxin-dependent thiol peroxidase [Acidimicrobiales bacterium]